MSKIPPHIEDELFEKSFRKRWDSRLQGTWKPPQLPRAAARSKLNSRRHLVIGDSHAHPDVPNQRFDWLARLVVDVDPDVVIDMGDSADLPSLHDFDSKGAKQAQFERRRYCDDLDSYLDSRERLSKGLSKVSSVRLVRLLGNHENRIHRVTDVQPVLKGWLSYDDLRDTQFGWEVQPYLRPIAIDGIHYSHYFKAPGGKNAVNGVVPSRAVLMKMHGTAVFGHTHRFGYFEESRLGGGLLTVINAGCYFDPRSSSHDWAGMDVENWRAGILELEIAKRQILSFRWHSYEEIRERYA